MDYNIETFPKAEELTSLSEEQLIDRYEDWKEGFTKELIRIYRQHKSGRYWSVDVLIQHILHKTAEEI